MHTVEWNMNIIMGDIWEATKKIIFNVGHSDAIEQWIFYTDGLDVINFPWG
jgi:hypothetical protein